MIIYIICLLLFIESFFRSLCLVSAIKLMRPNTECKIWADMASKCQVFEGLLIYTAFCAGSFKYLEPSMDTSKCQVAVYRLTLVYEFSLAYLSIARSKLRSLFYGDSQGSIVSLLGERSLKIIGNWERDGHLFFF